MNVVVPSPQPVPKAQRQRILLVEDDLLILTLFGEMLSGPEITISTALNADDALDALGVAPPPALLITDVDLGPGATGIMLARHARIRWPSLPVILISGHYDTDPAQDGLPGARLLSKPVRIDTLRDAVAEALRPR
jgi:two-component system NtrC family sensor kinase